MKIHIYIGSFLFALLCLSVSSDVIAETGNQDFTNFANRTSTHVVLAQGPTIGPPKEGAPNILPPDKILYVGEKTEKSDNRNWMMLLGAILLVIGVYWATRSQGKSSTEENENTSDE